MRNFQSFPLACLVVLSAASSSAAAEGALEINQVCATTTGCFAGDAPGFPVTVTAGAGGTGSGPGSYHLTSNLTVGTANTGAVSIQTSATVLDLGGFAISGPVVCTGIPVSGCSPVGGGVGVSGTSDVTVKNGTVTGFGGDGVSLGFSSRVSDLNVFWNGGNGISVGNESIVSGNIVTSNRVHGISGGEGSSVAGNTSTGNGANGASLAVSAGYSGNTFTRNGSASVSGGHATGGNVCSDSSCSPRGARGYYLTQQVYTGFDARTACVAGYHMAHMMEILDPTPLQYRLALGKTSDLGVAPPTGFEGAGWVATGVASTFAEECVFPIVNAGRRVYLDKNWDPAANASSSISPWISVSTQCSLTGQVWCVED